MSGKFVSDAVAYDFDDEYFAAVGKKRPLWEVADLPIYEGEALQKHAAKTRDIGFMQYLTKSYEATLVLSALRGVGKLRTFERGLDIGSGPALQSRYLKITGRLAEAEAIDLYDGRVRCPEATFRSYAMAQLALYGGYRLQSLMPNAMMPLFPRLQKLRDKYPFGVDEFSHRPETALLRFIPRLGPTLDRFIVGDVFSLDSRYDLITSFMALDYFDFDAVAAKVASLLTAGGVFAFIVSYWWYPINNTLLYGRFPYALQQLPSAEVARYFREIHPELPQANIARRMGYSDQKRLTIADYENIAYKHGLFPLAALRLHPSSDSNNRAIIGPLGIDRRPGWKLTKVVENAKRWKPELSIADLMTSHVLLAFEKQGS